MAGPAGFGPALPIAPLMRSGLPAPCLRSCAKSS